MTPMECTLVVLNAGSPTRFFTVQNCPHVRTRFLTNFLRAVYHLMRLRPVFLEECEHILHISCSFIVVTFQFVGTLWCWLTMLQLNSMSGGCTVELEDVKVNAVAIFFLCLLTP